MLVHPGFDPIAIKLGPVAIHWYGLMYLLGFAGAWWLGTVRARQPHWNWPRERVGDLLFYFALGVILGGRVGYTLFYNFQGFLKDPLVLLRIWEGGMSFHGGLLGVVVAYLLFARHHKLDPFVVADFAAPLVPFGLLTGRIGNFINAELWGKVTNVPWGMVFATAPDGRPRHPSMLYEAFLEGAVMLAILWWFGTKPRPRMAVAGLFLLLYGAFRFAVEFVRVPDAHIGYLAFGWFTMGMLLSTPMILAGSVMMGLAYRQRSLTPNP
ncbi:MAG TPA: prolipoprotein diacylglyceryl transferase [Verrucomicrobiae bacterium]|nr:prolipoprotein diacylglyceryl transferase [Verrucomicrobiae bacterium]